MQGLKVAGYVLWVAFTAFLLPALLIGLAIGITSETTDASLAILESSVGLLAIFALQFMLGFVFMLVLPVGIQKKSKHDLVRMLGIDKVINWRTVGYALLALVGYFMTSALLQVLVAQLVPGYNAEEVQELGFSTDVVGFELLIAGLALVVLAPIFEELIFRGYLFGALRPYISFWATALIVSMLFGIAHGQVNVGLDVFVLSIFMSLVREKTGTLWGPILMHMCKNGLAFTLLFIFKVV